MASRELLLDTSAVIELLRGNAAIRQRVEAAERVYVPSIAIGELLGARSGPLARRRTFRHREIRRRQ